MKKYLITYYTRTGTSKKAALRLYELLGGESGGLADIEEIIDLKNRNGITGWIGSLRDSLSDNITKIGTVKHSPANYLETIIVTPVWADKMCDAVRTYIAAYRSDIRALTIITCASGSDGTKIQKDVLLRFAIKSKLISLKQKDVKQNNFDESFAGILSAVSPQTNTEVLENEKET